MREDGSVRMTRGVHAAPVDAKALFQVTEHGRDESHVVHRIRQRISTTPVARVPGQETIREGTGSIGIHNRETLAVCHAIEFGVTLEPGGISAAAMERDDHREWRRSRVGRNMDDVRATPPTVPEREFVVATR